MTAPRARLTPSRTLGGTSKLAEEAMAGSMRTMRARMDRLGEAAVDRINELVEAELITDRPPDRRSPSKGNAGRRLLGSFRYRIIYGPKGGFPVRLEVFSLARPEKVNALESGAGGHSIEPRNGQFLRFPKSSVRHQVVDGATVFTNKGRGARAAYGADPWVKARKVNHPGNRPYGFMRRGLNQAVEAEMGRAVSRGR